MIRVTRYRRVPSRPNVSQWRAFPLFHGKLHPLRRDTTTPWMEPGDLNWVHPKSDLELVAAPWGEADDVPPGDKRRLSSLSSPNTTTYLVGAHREDTAEP